METTKDVETIREHDLARLTEDVGEGKAGEEGAVVAEHPYASDDPEGYTLELEALEGGEARLVEVRPEQIHLTWRHPANKTKGDPHWRERWTPEEIKQLRKELGLTQREMGPLIWEGSEATAQKNLARLERGRAQPSAAVARTLRRLREDLSKNQSSEDEFIGEEEFFAPMEDRGSSDEAEREAAERA